MSPAPTHSRGASWAAARIVIALRWPIVAFWIIVAAGATGLAPSAPITGGGISGLLPEDSTPIQAEQRSFDEFAFPVLSRVVVVQHNPDGLPAQTRRDTIDAATRLLSRFNEETTETSSDSVLAALPLINRDRKSTRLNSSHPV